MSPSPTSRRSVKDPPPGRRQRHRTEIRQRLIRAALKLFATRGLEATTIQDITDAADVAKGTFFNYFASKEQVLVALYDWRHMLIDQALAAAKEGQRPVRQILIDLLRGPVQVSGWSPELARSLLLGVMLDKAAREAWMQYISVSRPKLVELLAIGQERREVRSDVPAGELARILHELSFGTLLFWSLRPVRPIQRLAEANLAVFWSGIAVAPRPPLKKKR